MEREDGTVMSETATHRAPRWKTTLGLGDVWRNDALTFDQRRDEIARRVRAKFKSRFDIDSDNYDPELVGIIEELGDAETPDDFDPPWDAFYDWADAERVWVDLFTGRTS